MADALRRVGDGGATSLALLPADALAPLLAEARALPYRPAKPVVGQGDAAVHQDFDLTTEIPPGGALMALSWALNELIGAALADMRSPPLPGGFEINDYIVQRYRAGCAGMSPHRDHIRYTGLVAIVMLGGAGRFLVCDDRAGANEREIPTRPGDLLLMRAPGFQGRGDRPFHAVRDITADRYIIGLRHDARPERWTA
ncbi:MAG: hypothetical protein IMF08_06895 [Proteobacteria bacterium]|nr:hypothetical protein [Pseudomonadota bacterium]